MAGRNDLQQVVAMPSAYCFPTDWNVFKSFANSPRKPPQYAKHTIKHDIREYLSQNQLYMMNNRNSEKGPDMFDSTWSGLHNHNNA